MNLSSFFIWHACFNISYALLAVLEDHVCVCIIRLNEEDKPYPENDHKRLFKDKFVCVQRVFAQDLAFEPSYSEPF